MTDEANTGGREMTLDEYITNTLPLNHLARRELEALRAELREIREAAGPFASAAAGIPSEYAGSIDFTYDGGNFAWMRASDLRRLAAAVKGEKT